jgi:hypothetical protein
LRAIRVRFDFLDIPVALVDERLEGLGDWRLYYPSILKGVKTRDYLIEDEQRDA